MSAIEQAHAMLDQAMSRIQHPAEGPYGADLIRILPEDYFRIASLCGSITGKQESGNRASFTLGGQLALSYSGVGFAFRMLLARLAQLTNRIKHPDLAEAPEITVEELEREEEQLRTTHPEIFARFEERSSRFGRDFAMSSLLNKRRTELEEQGIREVNAYGFEEQVVYPAGDSSVLLLIKVDNGKEGGYSFSIQRLADPK